MNIVSGKLAAGALLGAAALSNPALAQESRKLDFGLNATVEHNSNVARTSRTEAALRGLHRADTIFTPSATFDVVVPVGRQALFLNGVAGYSFYQKNKELDRERLDLTGGLRTTLGPCGASFTGGYARGVSEIDDPSLFERVENIQETARAAVDVVCTRESGVGVVGSLSKDWTTNDFSVAQLSDSERTSAMLGMSYARPALGTITIFGNHEQARYPKRLVDDGYDLNAVGVTIDRQLGARIQGSVTVAYTRVDPQAVLPQDNETLETTAYSAALSYRVSNRFRLQATVDRSVTPSSSIGGTYDLTDSYRVSGDYDLGSRITINMGVGRVERDSARAILPVIQLTDSNTTAVFGSVRYKQSPRLSFTLSGGREKRTTNAPQFDYTNNRVGLTADLAF